MEETVESMVSLPAARRQIRQVFRRVKKKVRKSFTITQTPFSQPKQTQQTIHCNQWLIQVSLYKKSTWKELNTEDLYKKIFNLDPEIEDNAEDFAIFNARKKKTFQNLLNQQTLFLTQRLKLSFLTLIGYTMVSYSQIMKNCVVLTPLFLQQRIALGFSSRLQFSFLFSGSLYTGCSEHVVICSLEYFGVYYAFVVNVYFWRPILNF